MNTSPCKGCGRPVVWGETADGKKIPLDPRPPLYFAFVHVKGHIAAERIEPMVMTDQPHAPDGRPMVSHFATCPKASEFSGSRRK